MNRFCTSCGKPVAEGAGFCAACGARQSSPGAGTGAPVTAAPAKSSPILKIVLIVVGIITLIGVIGIASCVFIAYRVGHKAQQYAAAMKEAEPATTTSYHSASGMPYLPDAMTKMGDIILKPTSSFHLSFKKADSDGLPFLSRKTLPPVPYLARKPRSIPKLRQTRVGPGCSHATRQLGPLIGR